MSTSLSDCTREEQRSTIRFLWGEGCKGAEIVRRLRAQYGDQTLPQSTVFYWLKLFKDGRTRVSDKARSGRPVTTCTDANIAAVQRLIMDDRRISVLDIAQELDISAGSAFDIIHKKLVFRKVCARCNHSREVSMLLVTTSRE